MKRKPAYTLKIRGGCDTYLKSDGSVGTAGKGPLIQEEKSATLGVTQDQYLFAPRGGGTSVTPSMTGKWGRPTSGKNRPIPYRQMTTRDHR